MSERLDQIEAILATVAQQQQQAQLEIAENRQKWEEGRVQWEETRKIVDSTARSVAANSDLVAANTRNSAELDQRLESAARTAEANSVAITETRLSIAAGFEATRQSFAETRQAIAETRQAIAETHEGIDDVVRMVGTTSAQAQEDRQRSDRRFDAFLAQAQEDRAKAEKDRAKAEEDRQHNDQAHRAFTESFQSLLAEIARIWQRLSA